MIQPTPIQPNPEQAAPVQPTPETPIIPEAQLSPEQVAPATELPNANIGSGEDISAPQEPMPEQPPAAAEAVEPIEPPLANEKELDKEYIDRIEEARDKLSDNPAELKDKFSEIGQHYLDERFGKEI